MNDYLLLMHDDAPAEARQQHEASWPAYLASLRASGRFEGGSAIGGGICANKNGVAGEITEKLVGYLKVRAESLDAARKFLPGNPVFEAGGTVEIRELPRS